MWKDFLMHHKPLLSFYLTLTSIASFQSFTRICNLLPHIDLYPYRYNCSVTRNTRKGERWFPIDGWCIQELINRSCHLKLLWIDETNFNFGPILIQQMYNNKIYWNINILWYIRVLVVISYHNDTETHKSFLYLHV